MLNHTPLPWNVRSDPYGGYGVGQKDGPSIFYQEANGLTTTRDRNDAEFIVRACNVHYELLAFMEDIRPFLGHDPEATLWKQADVLIAKAKGETHIAGEATRKLSE
jgi:hypothetical protein